MRSFRRASGPRDPNNMPAWRRSAAIHTVCTERAGGAAHPSEGNSGLPRRLCVRWRCAAFSRGGFRLPAQTLGAQNRLPLSCPAGPPEGQVRRTFLLELCPAGPPEGQARRTFLLDLCPAGPPEGYPGAATAYSGVASGCAACRARSPSRFSIHRVTDERCVEFMRSIGGDASDSEHRGRGLARSALSSAMF